MISTLPTRASGSTRRIALAVLCVAQFMLIVDIVALNVALPSIQRGLAILPGQVQLASITYTLTFGSLLIVAGRAGDLFGRRRMFRAGLAVFTIASVLAAVAQTGWQLFAGRALQGVGAAMVSPAALALLTSTFAEGKERNRAIGIWGAIGSGGAVAGQLLGGVLTDAFGWRSIFLINVPVGVVAIVAAGRLFAESSAGPRRRLDLGGAALLTASVAAFSLALAQLVDGGRGAGLPAMGAVAVLLMVGFWLVERRHPEPLVRFGLLRSRSVRTGNMVLALLAGATGAALFFTTLYLQGVLGYSPSAVGAMFAPVTVIVLVVSPYAGRLAGRVGVRTLLVAGTAITCLGLLHLSLVGADGGYLRDVLPGLAAVALGNGLAFAPTMIAATSGVETDDQGLASGLLNTSQELGTAIGLAVLAPIAAAVTAAVAVAGSQPGTAAAATTGYRVGFLVAAGLIAVATAVSWRVPRGTGRV